MSADHHDRVMAMTSHIPQLIAYSIVATASKLETHIKDEVIFVILQDWLEVIL